MAAPAGKVICCHTRRNSVDHIKYLSDTELENPAKPGGNRCEALFHGADSLKVTRHKFSAQEESTAITLLNLPGFYPAV